MSRRVLIKKMSPERFEALTYSKHPIAEFVSREVEWFSDNKELVLGAVALDLTDKDWSWVVLGRDEAGLFRAIDLNTSILSRSRARTTLKERMRHHARTAASAAIWMILWRATIRRTGTAANRRGRNNHRKDGGGPTITMSFRSATR